MMGIFDANLPPNEPTWEVTYSGEKIKKEIN